MCLPPSYIVDPLDVARGLSVVFAQKVRLEDQSAQEVAPETDLLGKACPVNTSYTGGYPVIR